MKLYLYTLVLVLAGCASKPPQHTYYKDYVVQCPRCEPNPIPADYWKKLIVPYNPHQIVRVAEPVPLPNQNSVGALPGQTEEQRRQMQNLVK